MDGLAFTVSVVIVMFVGLIWLSFTGSPTEQEKSFIYPSNEPTFLQYENVIISYKYIDNKKHLVVVNDNDNQCIMPLFEPRKEALDFMHSYFIYLKGDLK